jgi:YD repeat-containing protein
MMRKWHGDTSNSVQDISLCPWFRGDDSLGRLTSANSVSQTAALNWGQAFVYDPFGNLLQQNVTSGSAPTMNLTVDPTTNRITTAGFVYDAAGDQIQAPTAGGNATYTYDTEGRLSGNGTIYYDTAGRRLFDGTNWYFYGPDGSQMASLLPQPSLSPDLGYARVTLQARFAGRLVYDQGNPVVDDRLGSVVQTSQGSSGVSENAFSPTAGRAPPLPQAQRRSGRIRPAGTSCMHSIATTIRRGGGLRVRIRPEKACTFGIRLVSTNMRM